MYIYGWFPFSTSSTGTVIVITPDVQILILMCAFHCEGWRVGGLQHRTAPAAHRVHQFKEVHFN